MVRVEILGSLQVRDDGRDCSVGSGRQRALLALLVLHNGELVSSERLVDALWGERPPATAAKALQGYVSQLRRSLSAEAIETRGSGYALRAAETDVGEFERLIDRSRGEQPRDAAATLRAALALWRGPPLVDVEYELWAQPEIARLEDLRLAALDARIAADIELGEHARVVSELESLVVEHPLRERLHGQLMLALYRCGRQARALEVYRVGRRMLVEELGLEPGPALQRLEQEILNQSVGLEPGAAGGAHRLPTPPNRTLGRTEEVGGLVAELRAGATRIVTLTGPGGVGKTRLALETARVAQAHFVDGARFVSLAALERPEDVAPAIVGTLGIPPLPGELPAENVERFLAGKHLLLVMDNFEHLLPAASLVADVVGACPSVTVLATSREPLDLQAEHRHPVAPLAPAAAVGLFGERAGARDPAFRLDDDNAVAVAEICRRLDGLPLAIELAAARCGLLSPPEIAARLDSALDDLGGGVRDAPARQRTLRATIAWSYELLDENERRVFERFAVFAGGATVAAAQQVTGADATTLEHLVAKNLLVRRRPQPDGATRLIMLRTIRAFAAEQLAAAPDCVAVRGRHYRCYLELAEAHGPQRVLWSAHGHVHHAALDADIDNIHAALGWAIERGDAAAALGLCVAVGHYWLLRSRYLDASSRIDEALAIPRSEPLADLRVRALRVKTYSLRPVGRGDEQLAIMEEAEALARELGNADVLAETLRVRADREGTWHHGDVARAYAAEAMALSVAAGDDWGVAMGTHTLAMISESIEELRERVPEAAEQLSRVDAAREVGDLYTSSAWVALELHADAEARALAERAVPIVRALDDGFLWMVVCGNLGLARLLTGEPDAACAAFLEELTLCRELVVPVWAREGLLGLAAVAAIRGDDERAARLTGAADAHRLGEAEGDIMMGRIDAAFCTAARGRLGDRWDPLARDGAALGFDAAIAYALDG
jgi:predicted ATPase/DNA-binding SARP family transcriptional activator